MNYPISAHVAARQISAARASDVKVPAAHMDHEEAWLHGWHHGLSKAREIIAGLAVEAERHDRDLQSLLTTLELEIGRQDAKHGRFETGTRLGRSRLALACLQDEVEEALLAWRKERSEHRWTHTAEEVLQIAAVAIRALRDAL